MWENKREVGLSRLFWIKITDNECFIVVEAENSEVKITDPFLIWLIYFNCDERKV